MEGIFVRKILGDYSPIVSNAIKSLVNILGILNLIFYPILAILNILANFKIDLASIYVTCAGSSSSIELALDVLVLRAVILVIESKYQIFRTISFQSITEISGGDYFSCLFAIIY